ncbi:MAG TPA: universal stress protein [Ideonella sp.]|uniref:universal stress protein n=1 Tax=Ideonella sp. TaxID=1929293 RepID=UPI002E2FA280|nr:universal stress protein [Ideonella sp.]HEX5685127.1 universal stress protein [Ideonella sp.]
MYARILVPVDGSPTSELGLGQAIELASALKSHLVLLCVVDDFSLRTDMVSALSFDDTRARLLAYGKETLAEAGQRATQAGLSHEAVLREVTSQRVADVIVEEATRQHCGLIAMGTHGRRGLNRLAMGSDAALVLREAPVPVLLVRGHGDE